MNAARVHLIHTATGEDCRIVRFGVYHTNVTVSFQRGSCDSMLIV